MIHTLAFANYRSLCDVQLAVGPLTVITGGNGTGKSNVYRALRLLVDAAEGQLGRAITRAAKRSQIFVISHAPELVDAITGATRIELVKTGGATSRVGHDPRRPLTSVAWKWTP
jgi:predicted ATPase